MKIIYSIFFALTLFLTSCGQNHNKKDKMNHKKHKFTNNLIHESSPYLLQHAHNPVNWYPWGQEALDKAKKENKLIIISIGYSACHWCHVMEHESFENEDVAKFMNDNFISIKIDREERPDIDQVYMNAVQILTGSGGWPLNCIALPDGRPIYGGTYFPKKQWVDMLSQVLNFVKTKPEKAELQAKALTKGVASSEMIIANTDKAEFTNADLNSIFDTWKNNIDYTYGGHTRAPKFPLPVGYQFLLQFSSLTKNSDAMKAVDITLNKMANGGIYDQIGGGFARYSVDKYWKVPHFEKMLYDNAQLVSLYSKAYQKTKNPKYKIIVEETLEFVERELLSDEGGFYSSLDADSEGEEGKFYVWTKAEIIDILGKKSDLIISYYNITDAGNWEHGNNILLISESNKKIARKFKISEEELEKQILDAKKKLLKARDKRIRPGLDDKILTSWNALMLKAYIDAYQVFGEEKYLKIALKNADFINSKIKNKNNRLNRNYKNKKSSINGFLDDYAFTIQAFIELYRATFDEKWLIEAKELNEYSISHFYDKKSGMFYYTSNTDAALIARKFEITDNVIPSSNSQTAKNLFQLGHYFYNENYIEISKQMLNNIKKDTQTGGAYYANWDILMAWFVEDVYQVAIIGNDYKAMQKEFNHNYLPNVFLSGGKNEGNLQLHKNKLSKGKTTIYVCRNKACSQPVTTVSDALKQIK